MKAVVGWFRRELPLAVKITLFAFMAYGLYAYVGSIKENIYIQDFFTKIDRIGFWGPLLFGLAYVCISGIFIPSIIFKIAAGTLFGIYTGVITVSIASTISSFFKFLLARYFFKEKITKKLAHKKYTKYINRIIKEDGFRMLIILRNVPLLNSMFLNYLCGVTKMKSWDFVLASFIGRLPTTFLYVYLGFLVGHTAGLDTANPSRMTMDKILLWCGLLASVALAYYSIYISKKVLEEKLPEEA